MDFGLVNESAGKLIPFITPIRKQSRTDTPPSIHPTIQPNHFLSFPSFHKATATHLPTLRKHPLFAQELLFCSYSIGINIAISIVASLHRVINHPPASSIHLVQSHSSQLANIRLLLPLPACLFLFAKRCELSADTLTKKADPHFSKGHFQFRAVALS